VEYHLIQAVCIAQDLCSLAPEVGMSEFTERLSLLTQLRDLWAEGLMMATDLSESSSDVSELFSLKRLFPEDSPQSTKQSKNNKTKTGECICAICQDPTLDATKTSEGQDSIVFEGQCSAWMHRWCAGLSKSVFDTLA